MDSPSTYPDGLTPAVGLDTGCCLPRSLGECWPCHLSARVLLAEHHEDGATGWAVAA